MVLAAGLWRDGWFYVSLFGLMASAALFVYFLEQYRASATEEDTEPRGLKPAPAAESAVAPKPILPRAETPAKKDKAISLEEPPAAGPQPKPSPKPQQEPQPELQAIRQAPAAAALGGEIAATVQDLAKNFDRLEGEISSLKSMIAQRMPEREPLLSVISEIKEKLQAAPAPAPEPRKADPEQTGRALAFIEELLQKMRGFEAELAAIKTLVSQAKIPPGEAAPEPSAPDSAPAGQSEGGTPAQQEDPAGRRRPVWPV